MSAESVVYLDSSALVKLVVRESESDALAAALGQWPTRVASGLAKVEVLRAVRGHGDRAIERARRVLDRMSLISVDDRILEEAGGFGPTTLRSLDAIHLASAAALGSDLQCVITYDRRMAEAARELGMSVTAPG